MALLSGVINQDGVEELRTTAEKAVTTTKFWRERFDGVDVGRLTPDDLSALMDRVVIRPDDLYDTDAVWPDYVRSPQMFYTVMRTSGTTGIPKRIPYTYDDRVRTARQVKPWITEYMDRGDRIASFFPPLPSSSGMFAFGSFEALNARSAYYQIPIRYLLDRNLLVKEFQAIRPTAIFCLTATAYNLGLTLPQSIKDDVNVIVVGGETLTPELATSILELFENAVVIDNFGSTEDAITGYRIITKKESSSFKFEESIVVMPDSNDGYSEYRRIYITKLMREGEFTGLPLFNYDIGDLARVEDGEVKNIIRIKDVVVLAGAKLHIDQVMGIIYSHPSLKDFVMVYTPLSPSNPRPKVTLRVAYEGHEKPAGIEDEVRDMIYEANNPVRYEVEESKQAELEIVAVPLEKLYEGLPRGLGKTKRIYIVGKDL